MSIDVDTFKTGMRRLAGHVCVITTVDGHGMRWGLTATAVCPVSASPPVLLCCINRQNASHQPLRAAGVFAVNVLSLDDRDLADRFARAPNGETRFAVGSWTRGETGAPLLCSALAGFECQMTGAVDVGSHGVLFGHIAGIRVAASLAKPLLYAHGQYGGFSSLTGEAGQNCLGIPSWGAGEPDLC